MNRLRFSFSSIMDDNFFPSLANTLSTYPDNENVSIPEELGKGFIFKKELSKGISLVAWDFILNRSFTIIRNPTNKTEQRKIFILAYILEATNVYLTNDILNGKTKNGPGTIFMAGDTKLCIDLPAGTQFKSVLICLSEEWLTVEMPDNTVPLKEFLDKFRDTLVPAIVFEACIGSEIRVCEQLINDLKERNFNFLCAKAKAISLVSDYFLRLFNKSKSGLLDSKKRYIEAMQAVEKLLRDHLEKKLPDIDRIAIEMAMSTSSLKRHFKVIYNCSIYEYYLRLKMEHGRKLLLETAFSVNEIAGILDYEKVSCFIQMFKKHYGVSPGILKKTA